MNPAASLDAAEELLRRRELDAAQAALSQAEEAGADADRVSGARWLLGMLRGNFAACWRESDAIRRRGAPDPHRFWQGEDIRGKRVIVRSLHGYGDAVQMLRFAPRLNALARSVAWEVAPWLVELARCFVGVDRVITWGHKTPATPVPWDVQIEITELPYLLRLTDNDLKLHLSVCQLPQEVLSKVGAAMESATTPRVGLVWTCGGWNPDRGLPDWIVRAIVGTHAAEFWNLEPVDTARKAWMGAMRDAQEVCGDGLIALAATICNLDLVITPDTLAAHLAGTLGRPVWLLLQHAADWRWQDGRNDSPWYPSMRLFRQPAPGDWAAVEVQVDEALREFARRDRG